MKNILWLASWYPSKVYPLTGDFIERHAVAASLHNKITVLHIVKDDKGVVGRPYFVEERKYNDNCTALILYYKPFSRIKVIESVIGPIRYCIFFAEFIRQHIFDRGKPHLVHVHVAGKAGMLALYTKWRYKIGFVVTEHWSVFLPEAVPSFRDIPFLERMLMRQVFKRAIRTSTVSDYLSTAVSKLFAVVKPDVIPNVVDTRLFVPYKKKNPIFRFIHISEMNFPKNPGLLFAAVSALKAMRPGPFEMVVFGPDSNEVLKLAALHQVEDLVKFRDFVPQPVLAHELAMSDVLVMPSRYETFGCVVIEALAAGVPTIVSDIPVMREIVRDKVTGLFSAVGDVEDLAVNMHWMMLHYQDFDPTVMVAEATGKFSFDRVGRMFDALYNG